MTSSRAAAGGDTADATPESGIVWVYHFQPDGTAELVPNERVEQALADHVGWTWVHLSLLDAVIDQFADAIGRMAERLGSELDNIEDTVMGDAPSDHRPRIGRVRLQAVRVHRQLALLRGMFHRLEPRVTADHPSVAQAMRALAQKLDAIDHEVGSLQERARLLLDEMAAKMAELTNRRLFTLSVLTACLLPPTLVTGFFGMNTQDMPFQNTDGGTWMALGVAMIASAASYWALRRMRAF